MTKISDAELVIMKVLWEKKETTSTDIIRECKRKEIAWTESTIRTLLIRLINKKAIGISEKNKRIYKYIPLLDENQYRTYKTKEFIDILFNGSVLEFISFILENDEEYCEEVKKMIKEI